MMANEMLNPEVVVISVRLNIDPSELQGRHHSNEALNECIAAFCMVPAHEFTFDFSTGEIPCLNMRIPVAQLPSLEFLTKQRFCSLMKMQKDEIGVMCIGIWFFIFLLLAFQSINSAYGFRRIIHIT